MKRIRYFFLFFLVACFSMTASAQIGLIADFESGIPTGWSQSGYSTTTSQVCTGTSIRDNMYSGSTTGNLTTPAGTSNGQDVTFAFDYKVVNWSAATAATGTGWGMIELQYNVNGGGYTTFHTINDANHVTAATCATVSQTISSANVPNAASVEFRILATWGTSGDYYLYLDNVSITQVTSTPPTCDAALTSPANAATGVSEFTSLNWSAASGLPTGYKLQIGTTMGGSDFLAQTDLGNVTTYTPTSSFATNTTYYVTVTPYNANGDATGCTEESFTTRAVTSNSAFPFVENFDAATSTPANWISEGVEQWSYTSNGMTYGAASDHTSGSGNYAKIDDSSPHDANPATLITPPMDLTGLTTPRLVFWFQNRRTNLTGNASELHVDVYNGSTWTNNVLSITTDVSTWTEYSLDLTAYKSAGTYIRIRGIEDPSGYVSDLSLDDIKIEETPSCLMPSALNATNITSSSANLGWTENGTATTWDIEWGATGFTQGSGTVDTSSNPKVLSGLTPNTSYEFYVRADCGGSGTSAWAGPYSFTTLCAAFTAPYTESFDATTLPNCWNQSATTGGPWVFGTPGFSWNNTGCSGSTPADHTGNSGNYAALDFSTPDAGVILEMPTINVSALTTPYLELYHQMCATGYPVPNETYIEAYNGTTWSQVALINTGTASWEKYGFDISSYVYNTNLVSLRFRAEQGGTSNVFYGDVAIDDVSIIEAPSCLTPTGLAATNISTSAATLGWTESGTATAWDIEWGAAGFTQGAGTMVDTTSANPYMLSGLTDNTTYEYYVRASCGGTNGVSAWAGPYAFSTLCNVYTVPYAEGFEMGYSDQATVAGCLSQESVSGTQTWTANSTATSYNRAARTGSWNAYLRYGNDDWLFIPIALTATKTYAVQAYARQDGTGTTNADVAISYGTMGTAAGMTNSIVPATGISDSYQLLSGTFTPTTTGTYYIGIKGYMNSSPWYVSLDDIAVYEVQANDVGAVAATSGNCSNAESVTVDIYNYGLNAQTSIPVTYTVNGGTPVTETWTGSLASGATAQYTFTATFDASVAGNYDIVAYTSLAADGSATNDTVMSTVVTAPVYAIPFIENFEAAGFSIPADWVSNGSMSSGNHSSLSNAVYRNMWSSSPQDFVTTLPKVGAVQNGTLLKFDYRYADYAGNQGNVATSLAGDSLLVQVSIDCGATFTTIDVIDSSNHVSSINYVTMTYDLSAYAGQNVVIRTLATYDAGDYFLDQDNFFIGAPVGGNSTVISNYNGSQITCAGSTDGVAMTMGTGGVAPYTYLWNDAAGTTNDTITGLGSGVHYVTITDAVGDSIVDSVMVMSPMMTFTTTIVNTPCFGGANGSVDLTVTGGTGAGTYGYVWSNLVTTQDLVNLAAGSYTVTVTDANGCTQNTTVSVTQPLPFGSSLSATSVSCNGGSDGSISLNVAGATAPYTYAWSNMATTQNLTAVPAGNYTVTVTDANGCTTTASQVISEPTMLMVTGTVTDASCNSGNGGNDGAITAMATGGTTPYTFAWSNGLGNVMTNSGLVGGASYMVTVTDANGCTSTETFNVAEPTFLLAVANISQAITCNGDSGSITPIVGGGTFPYSFAWSTSNGTPVTSLNNLTAGTYSATITDANGCMANTSVNLTQPDALAANTVITDALCNGQMGMANLNTTGGTGSYTFNWAATAGVGNTGNANLMAGSYGVTITDANNCSATETVTINEPAVLALTTTMVSDTGQILVGSATVSPAGGTAPYTYEWDAAAGNATTATASGLGFGSYTVIVTDANGCSETATVNVDDVTSAKSIDNITNLGIFPNPTRGNVTIQLELSRAADVSVRVYNLSGQVVEDLGLHNTTNETFQLDLSNYASGMYYVRFIIDGDVITRKLMLNK